MVHDLVRGFRKKNGHQLIVCSQYLDQALGRLLSEMQKVTECGKGLQGVRRSHNAQVCPPDLRNTGTQASVDLNLNTDCTKMILSNDLTQLDTWVLASRMDPTAFLSSSPLRALVGIPLLRQSKTQTPSSKAW